MWHGDDVMWHVILMLSRTKVGTCENTLYHNVLTVYTLHSQRYEKERVILKEDHIPYYCYLLFSGSVHVRIAKEMCAGNGLPSYTKSILQKGAIFGVRWRWEGREGSGGVGG